MQPHRSSALGYASAASAAHSRVYGACAAEAAASEAFGLSVVGCIRACRDFRPYPVGDETEAKEAGHRDRLLGFFGNRSPLQQAGGNITVTKPRTYK